MVWICHFVDKSNLGGREEQDKLNNLKKRLINDKFTLALQNTATPSHCQKGVSTTPPSTRSAAPVVAEESGEQT